MSLLNCNIAILAYADGPASLQPSIRLADLKWSMLGLATDHVRNIPIALQPNETMTVASTARTLSYSTGTSFVISQNLSGNMRITANFGQRVSRSVGDGTTVWNLTVTGQVTRITAASGSLTNFGNVQVGDQVNTSGFSASNQGIFTILSKGSNYIEFINQYAQAQSGVTSSPLSIFSSGPVQVGDVLDLSASQFAFPNQGTFPVIAVTDTYIDVVNPNVYPQTVTGVSTGVNVYPYAYKWMAIACDNKLTIGLNGNTPVPGYLEVEPPVAGDIVKNPGIFIKRGKVFQVDITNLGVSLAQGFLILAG